MVVCPTSQITGWAAHFEMYSMRSWRSCYRKAPFPNTVNFERAKAFALSSRHWKSDECTTLNIAEPKHRRTLVMTESSKASRSTNPNAATESLKPSSPNHLKASPKPSLNESQAQNLENSTSSPRRLIWYWHCGAVRRVRAVPW